MNFAETEGRLQSGVYAKRPITLVRGQGATLWDDAGNRYVDFAAGIAVAVLGHTHPALVSAISAQAGTLITAPELAYNDVRARYLARLTTVLPEGMERVYLCNSGTEAIEAAFKFARATTGRTRIVGCKNGFHGRTFGALSATHNPKYRKPFYPLVPDFEHMAFNDVDALDEVITEDTAAFVLELVQGEGGVRIASQDFAQKLQHLCQMRGCLLIVDEIQTGFGRTGSLFVHEQFGIAPDLLAMGKAIAGGVPMAAVGIGARVGALSAGIHGSTFGGNALSCAAAHAVLDVIETDNLVGRSQKLGAYFMARLNEINSPLIREVRGMGLMIGVELRVRVAPVLKAMMMRGYLVLNAGSKVVRFLPPLVISQAEIDGCVATFEAVLVEMHEGMTA